MISLPGTLWGCIGSLNMRGYEEMKSPKSSQRGGPVQMFVGPESSLGVSRQNIKKKIKFWVDHPALPNAGWSL